MELDVQTGAATVILVDGRSESMATSAMVANSPVRTMSYTPAEHSATIVMMHGVEATIPLAPLLGPSPVIDRPVVYLDQPHWSTLAWRLYGTREIPESQIGPADELIRRAKAREILLPISAGHALETSPQYGQRRQALASALLVLSGGWQMRHPIDVRLWEFEAVLAQGSSDISETVKSDVFTPATGSLFATNAMRPSEALRTDLSAQLNATVKLLSGVLAMFDILMGPGADEAIKPVAWAEQYLNLSDDPSFRALSRAQRRKEIRAHTVLDSSQEIAMVAARHHVSADVATQQIFTSLNGGGRPLPFFALWEAALQERLTNFGSKWEPNDLVDMMFLCCAGAYADIVVGERKATNYLNTTQKDLAVQHCPIVRTLGEAVELLDSLA